MDITKKIRNFLFIIRHNWLMLKADRLMKILKKVKGGENADYL